MSGMTGKASMSLPTACWATRKSCEACKFSQNSGLLRNHQPSRKAVSPVSERSPAMILLMRFCGALICRAGSLALMPISFSSSPRISPGWVAVGHGRLLQW